MTYPADGYIDKTVQYPNNWLTDTIDRIFPSPAILNDRRWLCLTKSLQEAPDRIARTFRVNIPYIPNHYLYHASNSTLLKIHEDSLKKMSETQLFHLRQGAENTLIGQDTDRRRVKNMPEYQARFQLIEQLIEEKKREKDSVFSRIKQFINSTLRCLFCLS